MALPLMNLYLNDAQRSVIGNSDPVAAESLTFVSSV